MESFAVIRDRAAQRKGGEDLLERLLGAAPLPVAVLDGGPSPLPVDALGIGGAGGADRSSPDDAYGHHAGIGGAASAGTASGARGGGAEVDGADRDGSADNLNGEDA